MQKACEDNKQKSLHAFFVAENITFLECSLEKLYFFWIVFKVLLYFKVMIIDKFVSLQLIYK